VSKVKIININTGWLEMEINIEPEYTDENVTDVEHKAKANGLLTVREVASRLNIHINTVRNWNNQGILKSFRIGPRGDRRFRKEDIDKFLWK
jgi:excisionase family DNA binding protein